MDSNSVSADRSIRAALLTISARRRYSPAGREAGIFTVCFPAGFFEYNVNSEGRSRTAVGVDNVSGPLLGTGVEETRGVDLGPDSTLSVECRGA